MIPLLFRGRSLKSYTNILPKFITLRINNGAHGAMVIVVGNGHSGSRSILDEAVWILQSDDTLGKCSNSTILRPAMGK